MLDAMGFDTGIDLARLLAVARRMPEIVGHEVPGPGGQGRAHHGPASGTRF